MQLTCPSCAHVFPLTASLTDGPTSPVRCPSCGATFSVLRHADGSLEVQSAALTADNPPEISAEVDAGGHVSEAAPSSEAETAAVFDDDARSRKSTVMEGPKHRDSISGLHQLEAFTPPSSLPKARAPAPTDLPDVAEGRVTDLELEPVTAAPQPPSRSKRSAVTGPRIILGDSVRNRIAVHENATSALDTVRDLDLVASPRPPTSPVAVPPQAAPGGDTPVRTSKSWSPSVDTEVTHEPSRPTVVPSRTLYWGLGAAAALLLLLGVCFAGWILLATETPTPTFPEQVAAKGEQSAADPSEAALDENVAGKASAPMLDPSKESAAAKPGTATAEDDPQVDDPAPTDAPGQEPDTPAKAAAKTAPTEPEAEMNVEAAPDAEPKVAAPKPATPREVAEDQPVQRAASHEVFDTSSDIDAPWLALRSRPHRRGKLLAEMSDDTGVRVVARRGTWWKIRIVGGEDDGLVGWAHKRWIRRVAD